MPFVKLDCAMLDSSIWPDKDARDIFITALLMAEPHEIRKETPTINVLDIASDGGWKVPIGWYGFVRAASTGIIHRAMVDRDRGLQALVRLCAPEQESRTGSYEGRRMARIDGGFLILNFMIYRERDMSAADRQKRWREKQKQTKKAKRKSVQNVTA